MNLKFSVSSNQENSIKDPFVPKSPRNCTLIELKKRLKKNKRDLTERLNEYFMERSIELQKKDFDFYTMIEDGQEVKKRKPSSHIDLIIEEFVNMKTINKELDEETKNRLKNFFQGSEIQK